MKTIPLTQNQVALVDDSDFEELSKTKWCAIRRNNGNFSAIKRKVENKKVTTVYMHRQITGAPKGFQVDHINHNTLDNRRCNLRICTNQQNNWNRASCKNSSSKFKGVSYYKPSKKWIAQICIDDKRKNLGYYKSEIQAAKIYDAKAKELFGKFAKLNFTV